ITASIERNDRSDFKESLHWLAGGGLVERLVDSGGVVLHVPASKRINLDFYKNNTIHFFLVPSLLTRALLAEVPFSALRAHIGWWLDLYRWEFPLPEREALAAELGRWLAHHREAGRPRGAGAGRARALGRSRTGVRPPAGADPALRDVRRRAVAALHDRRRRAPARGPGEAGGGVLEWHRVCVSPWRRARCNPDPPRPGAGGAG